MSGTGGVSVRVEVGAGDGVVSFAELTRFHDIVPAHIGLNAAQDGPAFTIEIAGGGARKIGLRVKFYAKEMIVGLADLTDTFFDQAVAAGVRFKALRGVPAGTIGLTDGRALQVCFGIEFRTSDGVVEFTHLPDIFFEDLVAADIYFYTGKSVPCAGRGVTGGGPAKVEVVV
jgi:hypothetical protein